MTDSSNQEAIMYMPAEPKLLEYAYRISQDVPFEADVVKFEKMKASIEGDLDNEASDTVTFENTRTSLTKVELELNWESHAIEHAVFEEPSKIDDEHFLTSSYEKLVNIFGRFEQESIDLGLSELG
jgi:hypothetical protein